MRRHTFVAISGYAALCEFPPDEDPLLAASRAGAWKTHPGWSDPVLWQYVAREERERQKAAAVQTKKRDAKRTEGDGGTAPAATVQTDDQTTIDRRPST